MEFLTLLALCFASIIIYIYMIIPKNTTTRPLSLPPGPAGYPVVGSLLEMVQNKPTFRWVHQIMQEFNTEIACIRLGNIHVIPVTSPELSREFLMKHDAVFASRPECMSAQITSNGYLSAVLAPAGDQWKKMRRALVSKVLSTSAHAWLHAKRCEEADHLVRHVHNQCRNPHTNGVVNVRDATRHYCGNVLRSLVFGKRFFGAGERDGGPGNEEREYIDAVFSTLSHLFDFAIADYVPWLEVFDIDGYKKRITEAVLSVRKYHDSEIIKRVEMWRGGVRITEEDILDVLINLKASDNKPLLSFQEIQAQVTELAIATLDNPSNAVEWTMAEMMNQPHILVKACQELDQVVGKERLVQESDLPKLNYIKACLRESFRLHPVTAFIPPHVATMDSVVGGYFIPKGSHVLLSRYGLGRNPRVWEEPLRFNPERHIVDEVSEVVLADNELRMISFSAGRRGCPGVTLGSTMTTMLLARLIQGFSWKSTRVDWGDDDIVLSNPLTAIAMPRLDPQLYMELM